MAVILFLLGAAVSITVIFLIVKIAVREAILETRRVYDLQWDINQTKIIKRAIIEALEERDKLRGAK
ncbi:MAG: hypothetical protein FWC32_11000 [Firmicutes bacterium]|nr:hypothetical protein [Bacillota bacterium]